MFVKKALTSPSPFCFEKVSPEDTSFAAPKRLAVSKRFFTETKKACLNLSKSASTTAGLLFQQSNAFGSVKKYVQLSEEQKVTPQTLKRHIKNVYKVEVNEIMVRNAIADSKRAAFGDKSVFGLVAPFLDALGKLNEGTTTGVLSKDGVFQRAFLFPGICRQAFEHTTKIVGLDECHVKAG